MKNMKPETPIYDTAKRLYKMSVDESLPEAVRMELELLAGELETSEAALYEDVYEQLCDMIEPHIGWDSNGLSSCSNHSLCASVTGSVHYLLEFWLLNRDSADVKHCKGSM